MVHLEVHPVQEVPGKAATQGAQTTWETQDENSGYIVHFHQAEV